MAGSFGSNVIHGAGGSGANWAQAVAPFLQQLGGYFMDQQQQEQRRQQEMADYEEQLKLRQHYENEAAKDAQAIKDEQRILAEQQRQQELERLFGPQQQPQAGPQNWAQSFDRSGAGMPVMAPQQPGPAPMVPGQVPNSWTTAVRPEVERMRFLGITPTNESLQWSIAQAEGVPPEVARAVAIAQGRQLNVKQEGEERRADDIQPARKAAEEALAGQRGASAAESRARTNKITNEPPKPKRDYKIEAELKGVEKAYNNLQATMEKYAGERNKLVEQYHLAQKDSEKKRIARAIEAKDAQIKSHKDRAEQWITKVNAKYGGGAQPSPAPQPPPAPAPKPAADPLGIL